MNVEWDLPHLLFFGSNFSVITFRIIATWSSRSWKNGLLVMQVPHTFHKRVSLVLRKLHLNRLNQPEAVNLFIS